MSNCSMKIILIQTLKQAWDAELQKFSTLKIQLSPVNTVEVCITAWALIHGMTSSMLQETASLVSNGDTTNDGFVHDLFMFKNIKEKNNHDFNLLREYCHELVFKHETNPAPGAARNVETNVISKSAI